MNDKAVRILVTVATALLVVMGIVSMVPLMFVVMLFDSPGAAKNPGTIALAIAIVSFPPACFLAIDKMRQNAFALKYRAAIIWGLSPLLPIFAGGIAILWLQIMYG